MFKVADKMASVCLWVGPAGSIPKHGPRDGMYVRLPGRRNRSKTSQTQNVTHTYTRASTTYTDLLKNRWKTDMQFFFFYKVRNKRNV